MGDYMGKKYKKGFLSDEQKLEYYMQMGEVNPQVYRHRSSVKIYEGAEILFYHFDSRGFLIFDTVLVCSGFMATEKMVQASFVDRRDFKLFSVRDIPIQVGTLDIMMSMPVRCSFERTVKVTRSGGIVQGMTAAVLVQSKSNPDDRVTGDIQAINLTQSKKRFSKAEFTLAENRAAMTAEV